MLVSSTGPRGGARAASAEPQLSALGEGCAGAAAGGLSRLLVAPLDVLKIRFQLQHEPIAAAAATAAPHVRPLYTSLPQAVRQLLSEEGVRTLWRGNASAMLLWVGYMGASFPVYRAAHSYFERPSSAASTPAAHVAPALVPALLAGAVSGIAATVLTYPLDWLRTRVASQGVPRQFPTTASLVRGVYAAEGAAGFFRGLLPTLLQIVPSLAITFAVYEQSGELWDGLVLVSPNQAGADPRHSRRHKHMRSLACGALAGTLGKLAVYPLDTVKKRLQVQGMRRGAAYGRAHTYRGTLDALAKIAREEGLRGLFKGLAPSLLKAAAGASSTFWCYEAVGTWLREHHWAVS